MEINPWMSIADAERYIDGLRRAVERENKLPRSGRSYERENRV